MYLWGIGVLNITVSFRELLGELPKPPDAHGILPVAHGGLPVAHSKLPGKNTDFGDIPGSFW